jgi:DNA-directed RNA polymerase sigma subunit (sigma70/sigma32)
MTDRTKDGDDNIVALSITQELLREDLTEVMAGLSPRERDVLNLRFGLADGIQRSIKEVSLFLGVTPERIRQIEKDSLRKLRTTNSRPQNSRSDSQRPRKTKSQEAKKKPTWRELVYPTKPEENKNGRNLTDQTDE